MKNYVLGIDGGGSKTEALLVELSSSDKTMLYTGGINSIVDGMAEPDIHLSSLIDQVSTVLLSKDGHLRSVYIGSAGLMETAENYWAVRRLKDKFPQAIVQGGIDAGIALEGATLGKAGVVVIAGTGSIAYSMDMNGKYTRCGGWGPIFGDEGSGYYMGCEALRGVAWELDGRGGQTALTKILREKLKFKLHSEFVDRIYSMSRKEIADISHDVMLAIQCGDLIALDIIASSAKYLAKLMITLVNQTDWGNTVPNLSYAGGIFKMGEAILTPLKKELAVHGYILTDPYSSPVHGAVLLAEKALKL